MRKILIIGAFFEEVRYLIKKLNPQKIGKNLWYKKEKHSEIYIFLCGIGLKTAKKRMKRIKTILTNIDIVYIAGITGACNPSLKKGDIIYPTKLYIENPKGEFIFLSIPKEIKDIVKSGTHYSSKKFIDKKLKEVLLEKYEIDTVDMEFGAIYPFIKDKKIYYLKTICDEINTSIPPFWLMRVNFSSYPIKRILKEFIKQPLNMTKNLIRAVIFTINIKNSTLHSQKIIWKLIR